MRSYSLFLAGVLLSGTAWCQDLPGMAKGILDQTELARKAIASHDQTAALDHVRQARVLAGDIQQHSPPGIAPILVTVL